MADPAVGSGAAAPTRPETLEVRDVMRRWFERVEPTTTVLEAARVMTITGQQALPVVHDDRLVGMIAEGDILARLLGEVSKDVYLGLGYVDRDAPGCYREICRLPVDALMSQRLVTVTGETAALRAAGMMRARRVQRLPVVDGDQLVGLVFQTDIHAALLGTSIRPA